MQGAALLDSNYDLDAVIVERLRMEQEKQPDIRLRDKVIIKNGPQAYKVAMHWVLVDRHTGEVHHHALKIETYRRSRNGWFLDNKRSITLAEEDETEITRLLHFLGVIISDSIPESSDRYIVFPVDSKNITQEIADNTIERLLGMATRWDVDILSRLVNLLSVANEKDSIREDTFKRFLDLSQQSGADILSRMIDWIMNTAQPEQVITRIESLEIDDLRRLSTMVGVSGLKNILSIWESNQHNNDEEFWQQFFVNNSFVFVQVFAYPVIVIGGKAYIGNKSYRNKGGNIVDFLCANQLTRNAVLVEIKTPKTRILSDLYRGDVYNTSKELSGAFVQVANYRNSLLRHYNSIVDDEEKNFEVFDPKCLIVIGNSQQELTTWKQKKSFELFRMGLKDIQVITFDELFSKVKYLVNLLEGTETLSPA